MNKELNKIIFNHFRNYDDYTNAKTDLINVINEYLKLEFGDSDGVYDGFEIKELEKVFNKFKNRISI